MKTKSKFTLLTVFLILLLGELKAQLVTFDNQLNCKVNIQYEMRDLNGNPCGVCATGTLALPSGITTLNQCMGYTDMCITIIDVGGCTPSGSNHLHGGACHFPTPNINGGASGCCGGYNWTATWNSGLALFIIN
jgi:hypothetical protein